MKKRAVLLSLLYVLFIAGNTFSQQEIYVCCYNDDAYAYTATVQHDCEGSNTLPHWQQAKLPHTCHHAATVSKYKAGYCAPGTSNYNADGNSRFSYTRYLRYQAKAYTKASTPLFIRHCTWLI